MRRPELSKKKLTISYSGVPKTRTERATNKYPKRKSEGNVQGDVPVEQWSEVFEN